MDVRCGTLFDYGFGAVWLAGCLSLSCRSSIGRRGLSQSRGARENAGDGTVASHNLSQRDGR